MNTIHTPKAQLLFVLGVLLCTLSSSTAQASTPLADEDEPLSPQVTHFDDPPPFVPVPANSKALWIALQVGITHQIDGRRALTAMLLAGIPLERFTPSPTWIGEDAPAKLKPPPHPPKKGKQQPTPESLEGSNDETANSSATPPAPQQVILPVRVTPDVARAAVQAALRHAHLTNPEARIDALAFRARASALLPELRLRASRLVDEAQNLSPTEYDPARVTASGGTSFVLEARTTWRFDRVLFADEEIALERIRHDRAEAQTKLASKVLELLFAWQRALAIEADPARTAKEHLEATLKIIETEASLDVMTGGWFSKWRQVVVSELPHP